jgi:hypothetical protein
MTTCIVCGHPIHVETDAHGEYWAHDDPDPDDEHRPDAHS